MISNTIHAALANGMKAEVLASESEAEVFCIKAGVPRCERCTEFGWIENDDGSALCIDHAAAQVPDSYESGYDAGYESGYDAGWEAGQEAAEEED